MHLSFVALRFAFKSRKLKPFLNLNKEKELSKFLKTTCEILCSRFSSYLLFLVLSFVWFRGLIFK